MKKSKTKRIEINSTAEQKLNSWIREIEMEDITGRVSPSKLLCLILESMNDELPKNLKRELIRKLYDPMKAIERAASTLRKRVKSGEEVRMDDFISLLPSEPRQRKKTSKPSTTRLTKESPALQKRNNNS